MKISLFDSKTLLILLAAGHGANLVYASVVLDGHIDITNPMFWLALIKGLILGVAVSFSASYSAYQLPRVKKVLAQKIGWSSLGVQILCSATVVAFCTVQEPVDWQRWVVGAAYSIMVEASVLVVSISSGKLFAEEQPTTTAPAPKQPVVNPVAGKIDPVVLDQMVKDNPKIKNNQLADFFGVSPQAVQKHRSKNNGTSKGK
jgi:hypothetical protein